MERANKRAGSPAPASTSASTSEPPAKRRKTERFLDGRIFLTPTSGRTSNTMHIRDLLDADNIKSAAMYFFFIAEQELFDLLPRRTGCRVIVGRDISQCPLRNLLPGGGEKINATTMAGIGPIKELYRQVGRR